MKLNFTELVEESRREPIEIEMPVGDPIVVEFPDGDQAKKIANAARYGGDDEMILALFGEANGKRLMKAFAKAPADVPGRLAQKIMREFGMPGNLAGREPSSPVSSTS